MTSKDKPKPSIEPTTSNYRGEFIHNEEKVSILVEPDIDRITLDFIDTFTNEQYAQFEFDSYTLFLITETTKRMFKELDNILTIY